MANAVKIFMLDRCCEDNQDFNEVIRSINFIFSDNKKLLESALETLDCGIKVRCIRSATATRSFWIVPSTNRGEEKIQLFCYQMSCCQVHHTYVSSGIARVRIG